MGLIFGSIAADMRAQAQHEAHHEAQPGCSPYAVAQYSISPVGRVSWRRNTVELINKEFKINISTNCKTIRPDIDRASREPQSDTATFNPSSRKVNPLPSFAINSQDLPVPPLVVVGSANADIYVEIDRLPKEGETISARTGQTLAGGKGANQAVCGGKLLYPTYFVGQVGEDAHGKLIAEALKSGGVRVDFLSTVPAAPTGHAVVMLQSDGQNSIIIVGGANMSCWPETLSDGDLDVVRNAGIVLLQREIPDSVNIQAAKCSTSLSPSNSNTEKSCKSSEEERVSESYRFGKDEKHGSLSPLKHWHPKPQTNPKTQSNTKPNQWSTATINPSSRKVNPLPSFAINFQDLPIPPLVVVGSANADIYVESDRLPKDGETISARTGQTLAGGKGANQAVRGGRLSYPTYFVCQVDEDAHGKLIAEAVEGGGVRVDFLSTVPAAPMGACCGDAAIGWAELDYNCWGCQHAARSAAVPVILDAGGVDAPIPPELLNLVDILSPNETELARLTGMPTESFEQISQAVVKCHELGVKQVLVKLGAKGSALFTAGEEPIKQPIISAAKVLDTTGAGDTFTAAFAVALVEGKSKKQCLRFAAAAASLCVQVKGAIPSMPDRKSVMDLLQPHDEIVQVRTSEMGRHDEANYEISKSSLKAEVNWLLAPFVDWLVYDEPDSTFLARQSC
ncbi:hypothetical protein RJ640_006407 [Escallonia rubra]|uniref:Ribokinase n=1 Tax=Escallonia rubra TaxID=112253 RepID=A0AA88RD79_9ASTE|nr:hypothetical protein RJ640_006407 [Escallonia rubra]